MTEHFSGDIESIRAGGNTLFRFGGKAEIEGRSGRVVRRYEVDIPIDQFEKWQDHLRRRARGYGLYALYARRKLLFVGLATNGIRARIRAHLQRGKIPFTHFSVFLVTGRSAHAQARRIRDLEALLLNVLQPLPDWNRVKTHFVGARRLKVAD